MNITIRDIERALEIIDHVPREQLAGIRTRISGSVESKVRPEMPSTVAPLDPEMLTCAYYLLVTSDAGLARWFSREAPQ
jgi:hypothetical protein